MKSFFIVFSVVSATVMAAGTDYCKLNCKNYATNNVIKHIGCRPSKRFDPAQCSSNAKLVKITPALRKILVDTHNEKRNMVAGGLVKKFSPACRMATIQWDNELAKLAAFNVRQCTMEHDHCHNTAAFQYSGQNIAFAGQTLGGHIDHAHKLRQAVEGWFEESTNCNQRIIDLFPKVYSGPQITHFTVMMADRNIRLGCAASTYDKDSYSIILTVCNYATTNMVGSPIYKACSKPAEDCKTGTHPLYTNLCSVDEKYDVNKW